MPRLRFVSSVEGVSTIELEEPLITIGRGINNVVCIEDANISKHHSLLIQEEDTYKLIDLHSVNGTCVNGERITVARLKEGDAVRIGYLELTYEIAAPVARPVMAAPGKPRPAQPPPVQASAAASAPVGSRPRLGFGVSGKPTPAPGASTIDHPPAAPALPPPVPVEARAVAPAGKDENRVMIQVPDDKKHLVTGPPPVPAHGLGGPPRLKTSLHHETSTSASKSEPVAAAQPKASAEHPAPPTEQSGASAEQHPTGGPKKLGSSPGGAPKFRLKRE